MNFSLYCSLLVENTWCVRREICHLGLYSRPKPDLFLSRCCFKTVSHCLLVYIYPLFCSAASDWESHCRRKLWWQSSWWFFLNCFFTKQEAPQHSQRSALLLPVTDSPGDVLQHACLISGINACTCQSVSVAQHVESLMSVNTHDRLCFIYNHYL